MPHSSLSTCTLLGLPTLANSSEDNLEEFCCCHLLLLSLAHQFKVKKVSEKSADRCVEPSFFFSLAAGWGINPAEGSENRLKKKNILKHCMMYKYHV